MWRAAGGGRGGHSGVFRLVIAYLAQAFEPKWAGDPPSAILARLEGALIIARILDDQTLFEQKVRT